MHVRSGTQDRQRLKPGFFLIIKADIDGSGRVGELPLQAGVCDSDTFGDKVTVAPGKTVIIDPRNQMSRWLIESEGTGVDVEQRAWVQNSELISANRAEKPELASLVKGTLRVNSSHPDHECGFYVINESDFDPKIHELWKESGEESAKTESECLEAEAKREDAETRKASYASKVLSLPENVRRDR